MKYLLTILMAVLVLLGNVGSVQAQGTDAGTVAFVISGVDEPDMQAILDWLGSLEAQEAYESKVPFRSEVITCKAASEIHSHVVTLAGREDVLMVMVVTPAAYAQFKASEEAINPLLIFPASFGPDLRRPRGFGFVEMNPDMGPSSDMGPLSAKRIYVGNLPFESIVDEETGNIGAPPSPYILMMPMAQPRINRMISDEEWEQALSEIGVDVDYHFKDWFTDITVKSYNFLLNVLDEDNTYQGKITIGERSIEIRGEPTRFFWRQ